MKKSRKRKHRLNNLEAKNKTEFFGSQHQFFNSVPGTSISFFQPKLSIGHSNDKYEKQADQVADQIVKSPSLTVQKQSTEKEEETIQAKGTKTGQSISRLANQLQKSNGSGNPLPGNTQAEMGQKFGVDFSNVRVHTDDNAAHMNQELNAQAFTHGSSIYFNSGNYNLQTSSGKHLLAHELTHVVQQNQNAGAVNNKRIFRKRKKRKRVKYGSGEVAGQWNNNWNIRWDRIKKPPGSILTCYIFPFNPGKSQIHKIGQLASQIRSEIIGTLITSGNRGKTVFLDTLGFTDVVGSYKTNRKLRQNRAYNMYRAVNSIARNSGVKTKKKFRLRQIHPSIGPPLINDYSGDTGRTFNRGVLLSVFRFGKVKPICKYIQDLVSYRNKLTDPHAVSIIYNMANDCRRSRRSAINRSKYLRKEGLNNYDASWFKNIELCRKKYGKKWRKYARPFSRLGLATRIFRRDAQSLFLQIENRRNFNRPEAVAEFVNREVKEAHKVTTQVIKTSIREQPLGWAYPDSDWNKGKAYTNSMRSYLVWLLLKRYSIIYPQWKDSLRTTVFDYQNPFPPSQ